MQTDRSNVTEMREDVSRFVVHLTRDDRDAPYKGGATARENFLAILDEQEILAVQPHCLHGKQVKMLDKKVREKFNVACFTEVPLSQVRHLIGAIAGRRVKLASYGFVFNKSFLIYQGAQPAIYINSYGGNAHLREAVDKLWDMAVSKSFDGITWRLLPFVNAMHERYDFTWEREWRVQGSVDFGPRDLVCAILPDRAADDDIRERLAKAGIAAISPEWTYERIVSELAKQQRKTKLIIRDLYRAKAMRKGAP